MEAEVLLDVLGYTLAETEPMKIGDTLADVEGIAYTIREEVFPYFLQLIQSIELNPFYC